MKPKLNLTQIIQLQAIIIAIIIFIIVIFSIIFLYQNFYKTLTDTKEIIVIREQITLEPINTDLFNTVIKHTEDKKIAPDIDWATYKNPFRPYTTED